MRVYVFVFFREFVIRQFVLNKFVLSSCCDESCILAAGLTIYISSHILLGLLACTGYTITSRTAAYLTHVSVIVPWRESERL